ncbi:hypothetical protein TURU_093326 [Turdus rufiventris]|nr:hypothetical protein TURU_093326 [Turdus rufiventris]
MPDSSRMDVPLAKAGPIRNGGNTSVTPLATLCWSRVLAGTCRPGERGAHWSRFAVGLLTLWGTQAGERLSLKDCILYYRMSPMEWTHIGEVNGE